MAIFLKNTVVYHLPKTGGTWVSQALQRGIPEGFRVFGKKHGTPLEIDAEWWSHPNPLVPNPRGCHKIIFLRSQTSWLRSYWRYRIGLGAECPWPTPYEGHILTELDKCGAPEFDEFIQNYLDTCPGFVTKMFADFMDTGLGKPADVGDQSQLEEHLLRFLAKNIEPHNPDAIKATPRQMVSTGPEVEWELKLWRQVWVVERAEARKHYANMITRMDEWFEEGLI